MKLQKIMALSGSLAALFITQASWAGGTDAGTVVNNTATLTYSVGGAAQSPITSPVSDFTVDRKIDLTVTGNSAGNVIVNPSTSGNQLIYKLKNEGNSAQDFQIDVSHVGGDQFDAGLGPGTTTAPLAPAACTYQIDGDVTVYTVGATATITALAKDTEKTITVSCNMPNRPDVNDGDLSEIDVLATAVDSGVTVVETAGADNEDTEDTVLADGSGTATDGAERNAKHSDTQTFEIDAPELSVEKTSAVIADPVNCPVASPLDPEANPINPASIPACTGSPKRIPGAIVEYTITVKNTSSTAATGVTITDTIQNEDVIVNYVGNPSPVSVAFDDGTDQVTATVDVPGGSVATPGEVSITFQVQIL